MAGNFDRMDVQAALEGVRQVLRVKEKDAINSDLAVKNCEVSS